MGFFRSLLGGIGNSILDDIGGRIANIAISYSLTYYYVFSIYASIALFVSTLLFIPRFIVTDIIASIFILLIFLVVAVFLIRFLIFIIPKIFGLIRKRHSGYVHYYNPRRQRLIGFAKRGIITEIPLLVISLIFQIGVLSLCLFIMRKTVLKTVEDVRILKLLIFPFTHSFDTIFRTNMSKALFGSF